MKKDRQPDETQSIRNLGYEADNTRPPEIDKPIPGNMPVQGLGTQMGLPEQFNVNNQRLNEDSNVYHASLEDEFHNNFDQDASNNDDSGISAQDHLEAALRNTKEMLGNIEQEPSSDVEAHLDAAIDNQKDMLNQMGEEDLPVNDTMEENVSRPDGYEEAQAPSDMGLSEEDSQEEPDLSDVLKDGLDSHAKNIKKEKVAQLVGEALDGFKANKEILERAQDKAPELYNSCLSMLKAMIEMSKMLGFGEQENPLESPEKQDDQDEDVDSNPPPEEAPSAPTEGVAQAPQS